MKLFYALIFLCLQAGMVNAQFKKEDVVKLEGTWQQISQQNPNSPPFAILRTFDKQGNYIQMCAMPSGSYIVSRAKFELGDNSAAAKGPLVYTVKETFTYSIEDGRLDHPFNFKCGIVTNNGQTFLLTEGEKKDESGVNMTAWREMWRKVTEPNKSADKVM